MKFEITYKHTVEQVWVATVDADSEEQALSYFDDGIFDDERLISEEGIEIEVMDVEQEEA